MENNIIDDAMFEGCVNSKKMARETLYVISYRYKDLDLAVAAKINEIIKNIDVNTIRDTIDKSGLLIKVLGYNSDELKKVAETNILIFENSNKIINTYHEQRCNNEIKEEAKMNEKDFNFMFQYYKDTYEHLEEQFKEKYKDVKEFNNLTASEKKNFLKFRILHDYIETYRMEENFQKQIEEMNNKDVERDCDECPFIDICPSGEHDKNIGLTVKANKT